MNKRYEAMLKSAKDLLENMDTDVFLDKFLELQEQATGPNIDEFMSSTSILDSFSITKDSCTSYGAYENIHSYISVDTVNNILDENNSKKGYFLEVRHIAKPHELKEKAVKVSYRYGFPSDDSLSQAA